MSQVCSQTGTRGHQSCGYGVKTTSPTIHWVLRSSIARRFHDGCQRTTKNGKHSTPPPFLIAYRCPPGDCDLRTGKNTTYCLNVYGPMRLPHRSHRFSSHAIFGDLPAACKPFDKFAVPARTCTWSCRGRHQSILGNGFQQAAAKTGSPTQTGISGVTRRENMTYPEF